jgi:DNA-binding response OmpR family regulator
MIRILVVEDDPSIRMARGYAHREGVSGRGRRQGGEGADKALSGRSTSSLDDVAPSTLRCAAIRCGRGPSRRLPVIMLSARGAEPDACAAELGADDYVTKLFH